MVTGRVEQGIVKTGDEVEIVGIRPSTKTTVTGARPPAVCLEELSWGLAECFGWLGVL